MATPNPILLPLKRGINKHAIVCVPKAFSGGTNLSKTLLWGMFFNSGDGELHGETILPDSLDSSAAITAVAVLSSPAAGAGGEKVRFELGYRSSDHSAGESADFASWQEAVAVSQDVSGWSAKTLRRITFTLTQANFDGLDLLEYYLKRAPTHADDNHGQDLLCHGLYLFASY